MQDLQITRRLKAHLILKNLDAPVILCIGSDRVTGDSLGPFVGHQLVTQHNVPAYVYGTLLKPVNALNLVETANFIAHRHPNSLVIAVDSSLGSQEEIGSIKLIEGGILPGAATGKNLPKVGDVSITATVAQNKNKELYSVRLGFVHELASSISSAISSALLSMPQKHLPTTTKPQQTFA